MMEKTFWVCVHGNVGRILNSSEDCVLAKNKKAAIEICTLNNDGADDSWGFVDVQAEENTPVATIKSMALQKIW